jgi:lysophospholipase L1-like esterase
MRLSLLGVLAAALVVAAAGSAWRDPTNFENSASHIISAKDAQASREPFVVTAPDASLVAAWSDQFVMKVGRAFAGQFPEFSEWSVSSIPGSDVPSGTPNDTSKPAVAVQGTKVVVAFLFNFNRTGGPGQQHDVIYDTGTLTSTSPGVIWDNAAPVRLTFSDADNARKVTVAYDAAGNVELAWQDDPLDGSPSVVRYLEVGSGRAPVVISDPGTAATWPSLAIDDVNRLHVAYTQNGQVLERFAVQAGFGQARVFGNPTLVAGVSAQRPALAIVPQQGGAGTPVVIFDDAVGSPCAKQQVFAAAPGVPTVQLSDCALAGNQDQATIAVRGSDKTLYAVWVRETKAGAPTGPLEESRLETNVGWRWWAPIEIVPTDQGGGWYRPSLTASPSGEQVLAAQQTNTAASGEEIGFTTNTQLPTDIANLQAQPIPGGGGVRLTWNAPPAPADDYHSIKILRKATDSFAGPNDPSAVVVGTLYTQIQVIGGHYQVTVPLPTTIDDTTASPTGSYVYKAFVSHRGPTAFTNFSQSPGYRFGTTVSYGSPPPPTPPRVFPGPPPYEIGVPMVHDFLASASDGRVDLSWTNPAFFDRIKLVRKANAAPLSETDGTLLLTTSTATSYADTAVTNGTTYYYGMFTEKGPDVSDPAIAIGTPNPPGAPFTYLSLPAGNFAGSADSYVLGGVFHVTQDKVILKIGRQYKAGSATGNQIGIWDDATGLLLASATVSPSTPSAALPTPVILVPGKKYVIGVKESPATPWSSSHQLLGLPPWLVIDDAAFANPASTLVFPNQREGKPGFSNEDWTITFGAPGSLPLTPPDPVTSFTALPGSARVDLAWTNPADFDNVQVVRKAGSPPAGPSDGTSLYTGRGTSFSDTSVTNGTTYYYAAWSVRRGEFAQMPATTSATPNLPAGAVTYTSTPTGSYLAPAYSYVAGAVFHVTSDQLLLQLGRVYQLASLVPNKIGIWDATTQALLYSATVSPTASTVTLTSPLLLTAGKQYVLGVQEAFGSPWSLAHALTGLPSFLVVDDSAFVSSSSFVYPSGRDGKPGFSNDDWTMVFGVPGGLPVSGMRAVADDSRIGVSWSNPSDVGLVKVVRKAGSAPTNPTDGTVVYNNPGDGFFDTGLTNGTTYYYAAWVQRSGGLSTVARASATPAAVPLDPVTGLVANAGDGRIDLSWRNPGPRSMAVIGDSVSTGGSIFNGGVDTFPSSWAGGDDPADGVTSHYERLLGANPAIAGNIVNYAHSGSPMSDMLIEADAAVASGTAYDYITFMAGSNDVCGPLDTPMTDPTAFRSQFRQALAKLNLGLAGARILVTSIPDWTRLWTLFGSNVTAKTAWFNFGRCPRILFNGVTDTDRATIRQRIIQLNQILMEECAAAGNCRFDMNAVFNWQFTAADISTQDYFHPSQLGQAHLADLTWAAGYWPDLTTQQIQIVRKTGSPPTGPADGTVVYNGPANAFADTTAVNGTTYYYGAYVSRGGQTSAGAFVNSRPSTVVVYTEQPSGDHARNDALWNIGTVFHVTQDKTLLELGRAYAPGSTASNQIGVWDPTTGVLLASATVNPLDPVAALTAPLLLQAGKSYVISVKESTGSPWTGAPGRLLTGLPAFLVLDDTSYNNSATFSYPGLRDNQPPPIRATEDWTMAFGPPGSAAVVLPPPVSSLQVLAGDTKVTLSWTNPTAAFDQVQVVRQRGAAPTSPNDGTTVYVGTGSSFTDTGLTNGQLYGYAVWVQKAGQLSPARVVQTTPTGIIPDPVVALQASPGDKRVDLSWTNPTSAFDAVKIVRKTGSAPANPGDGTTLYTGTGTTVADTGLTNGTLYYYAVWVQRGQTVSPAVRLASTPNIGPIAAVTNLQTMPGDARVDLSWTNPVGTFDRIHVVRKAGSAPAGLSDGTEIYTGIAATAADTGVTNGTQYFYAVWVERSGALSSPVRSSAVPGVVAPNPVTNLAATAGDRRVDLSWTNPTGTFDTITVVRKGGAAPAGPTDGIVIFQGNASSVADAGLTNGTAYFYAVWVQRGTTVSPAVRATGIPFGTGDRTSYTSTPTGTYGGIAANYTLGMVFHVTQDKALLSLGRLYKAGSTGSNQIGIWDEASGVLLYSMTVSPGAATVALPNPLILRAGKRYVLGVKETTGSPWSQQRVLSGLPSFLVVDDTAWIQSNLFTNPTSRDGLPGQSNEDWTMTFGTVSSAPNNPDPATNLVAMPGDTQTSLSWTNPLTPFDQVEIVRKAGSAPTDPSDGTLVYSGTGSSALADSSATAAVAALSAPGNLGSPALSGPAQQGQILSSDTGTWTNSPTGYVRQWRRCDTSGATCGDIGGQTGTSYTLVPADVGSTIRVRVTATNVAGSGFADSAPTAKVTGILAPASLGAPTVAPAATATGACLQNCTNPGRTLTSDPGTWSNGPTGFARQWRRCDPAGASCADIAGASGTNYMLTTADVGSTLRMHVTASNVGGSTVADSAPSAAIVAPATPNLVPDSSFESNPLTSSWTTNGTATFTWATDAYHSATHSLRIDSTQPSGTMTRWMTNVSAIPVVGGHDYGASAWLKTNGVTQYATLAVSFWNDTSTYAGLTLDSTQVSGSRDWAQVSLQATAPASAAFMRVEIRLTGSGTLWADDVSAIDGTLPPAAPALVAAPALTGTAQQGQVVTSDSGTWNPSAVLYAYQWRRCDASGATCVDIPAATGASHTIDASDLGSTLRMRVTAMASRGGAAFSDSAPTAPVIAMAKPAVTTPPALTGTAQQGQVLSGDIGVWSGGPTTFSRQWRRCDAGGLNCVDIAGQNASSYTLIAADIGTTIALRVTASNAAGDATADSALSAIVIVTPSSGGSGGTPTPPVVTGTPQQGQTLTADTGTFAGAPTSFSRQWLRCDAAGAGCAPISGMTGPSYTLTAADVGLTIRVRVTAGYPNGFAADIGLTNGTTYFYAIWAFKGGLFSVPVQASATPSFSTPNPVTNLVALPGDGQIIVSWTNPLGTLDSVKVVRKIGSPPLDPTDGRLVYNGTGSITTDSGLVNGTLYYYGVWVVRGTKLSSAVQASTAPTAATIDPVTNLTAVPGDQRVDLAWQVPTTPFDQVMVVRKAGSTPISPGDGQLVYGGIGTSASDTGGLTNGTAYFYAVWVLRGGQTSAPVAAQATPVTAALTSVTNLVATPASFSATVSWTNPTFRFDRVHVVRKTGSAPTGLTDGTEIYTGTGTSVTDSPLANGITVYYGVFVERDSLLSSPAVATATPVDPAADVTYTAAPAGAYTGTAAGYNLGAVFHVTQDKLLRKLGRVYTAGSTAGNQIGVYDGTTGTLLASAAVTPASPTALLTSPVLLTAGKSYVIGIKEAAGSPWSSARTLTGLPSFLVVDDSAYNTSTVFSYPNLRDNAPGKSNEDWVMTFGAVGAPPAPDPVTGLAALAGDGHADLAWTNPTTTFDRVVVVRKLGTAPASTTDGTTVYSGTAASYSDTGLTNGTTYYYGVWTQRTGVYSTVAQVTATPSLPAPDPVTGAAAVGGAGRVDLTWTNPATPFDSVQLVRKAGADPATPADGTQVYSGTGSSFADTGLSNGITYHYGIWTQRAGKLSSAAYAFATTSAIVQYALAPAGDHARSETTFNIGTVFHVTQDQVLLKLGRGYSSGSTSSNQIGVWDDATGALLASATVTPLAPAAALTTPLLLVAGKRYVLGIQETAGSPWSNGRVPTGLPASFVIDDSSYNLSSTFSFPGLHDNQTPPVKLAEDWTITFAPPGTAALVTPDPVTGLAAAAGDRRLDLSWTNPTTPFEAVRVVRKAGSAPPADPTDGALLYVGSGTAVPDTGLTNGARYSYGVWVERGGERSAERVVSATPTGANPDPVTNPLAVAGDTKADVSWTNPTSPFDRINVVRKAGAPPANPTDGISAYTGIATGFSDTGLVNGTVYYYAIWVQRGPNLSPAASVAATPAAVPVDPITNLQAAPGDRQIGLSWTSPTSFDTIKVVRKTGSTGPVDTTDGTTVFDGTGAFALDTGLVNGTTYQYAAWVVRGGRLSAPVRISAVPAVPAPDPVTGLHAVPGDGQVTLSWTAPTTSFDQIKVVRNALAPPAGPADGTTIYAGVGGSTTDTALTNATLYYYGVWVVRAGVASSVARASTVPQGAAGSDTYATLPTGDYSQAAATYNIGVVFHVTQDKALLRMGRAYKAGSTAGNQIGVWDATTGALLASAAVTPAAPTATLDNALVLRAGKRYVFAIKEASGSPWSGARSISGLPSYLLLDDTAYNANSTFSYPDLRDNQAAPIRVAEDWTMTFGAVTSVPLPPDPVTAVQAGVSDGRIDLSWTNPATAFDQVKVVRKLGSSPTDLTDGTTVYTGTGTSATDLGLTNGVQVNYAIWTIRGGLVSTPTLLSATPTPTPPGPVSGVTANPGDTQVTLNWTNPIGALDAVKVVRKLGGAPADPTDGFLVYNGPAATVTDVGLTNGLLYQYAIWVVRGGQLSSVVRTSATPVEAPLDPVTNVQATPGDLRADLSWTNPATPFDQIKVIRKAGSDPVDPTDGIVAYSGPGTTLTDAGLSNGVVYHYAIWAQRSGRLSAVARINATPVAPPLVTVTNLQATAANGAVSLTWTNPTSRFDQVLVVRKAGVDPATPTDGVTTYSGTAATTNDTGLSNGTTYHYAVFVSRDGQISNAARAEATPIDPASVLAYSAQPTGAYGGTGTSTMGAVFHVTDDKVMLTLGRNYKPASTGSNQIGIWDGTTKALLVTVTVNSTAPTATLATPLLLLAGKSYVIGVKETSGTPWSAARVFTGLPGFLVIDDSAFDATGTFTYPAGRDNVPGQSNEDWKMTFAAVGTVAAPSPVTALAASWNDTRVNLTWTNPTTQFDVLEVVRKAGSDPVDPTDGALVYSGTGTSFGDTGLTNGTAYHYGVWVLRGGVFSPAARVTSTPNVPVADVTGLTASPGDLSVDLGWTNPTARFDLVQVVRKAGSAPVDPTDGTIVYSGTGTSYADLSLANGTTYYYAVWVTRDGLLSFTPPRASVTPVAPPLVTVTALQATPGNQSVGLSWTNPTIRFNQVKVVRKAGADPADPTDGTLVYAGTGTSAIDIGLTNGTNYRYAVWVLRDAELSSAARVGATPYDGASTLTYTATPAGNYAGAAGSFNAGAVFHLTDDKVLLKLGRVFKAGSSGSNQIGIWDDATGTLLGSVTVSSGTPVADLATPIVLQAGKRYVVGVKEATGNPWSTARTLTGLPGFLVIDDTAYNSAATFSYPNLRDGKPGQSNDDWTMTFAAVGTVTAPAPVTGISAKVGDAKVDLAWTNPTTTFDLVKVVRKAGADPADPTDGTLLYSGTGTSATDSGLVNGTDYRYAAFTVRSGVLSTAARVAATPLGQGISNLQATPGDLRSDLTWTNPTTAFDQIRIVRKAGADPTDPTDGTLVYSGVGTSASDTGLSNGVEYHYAAWAVRGGQLSFVARVAATPVAPPLTTVTGLRAVAGNATVDLSWTNPTIRFDLVKVVRKAGADPADPTDGTLVYSGTDTSVSDTGLVNGTAYSYAVWVLRGGTLSTAARVSSMPVDPGTAVTYTSQPTGAYSGTSTGFNLGGVFHVTDAKALTKLGRVYKAGSTGGNQIAIWDEATGSLLVSASVTPSSPVATLATPLVLQAGKRYVIGIQEAAGTPWSPARALTGLPPFLVVDDTAYNVSSIFSYPNLRDGKPGQSNEDWTMTFAAVGIVAAPDPPTGLAAKAGDAKIDLTWTNTTTTFDLVKVVRKAGAAPADPTDGTLLFSGVGTSYSDTGVLNGTTYHYAVWTVRGGVLSTAARATGTPAVPQVTNLNATIGDGKVVLSWTNPTTAFDLVKVVRKAGGTPASPTDGTLVFSGTGTSVSDTGLVNGTAYGYAVWVVHGTDLSAPSSLGATPTFATPNAVTGLAAIADDAKVDLSWTNPTTVFDLVKVVRKAGADPADPTDGTLVYSGTGTSVSDTALANGTEYHYGVWVVRGSNLSTVSRAKAAPIDPATVVTYTAQPTGTYGGADPGFNIGAVFHVTGAKVLTKLGRVYKAGSTAGNQIGIWDEATGTLLASVAVTPAVPLATLPTPLLLQGGKRYVIGVKEAAGTPWSQARTLTGLPSFLVVDDTAYGVSSIFSYPNLRDGKLGQSNEDWTMSFAPAPATAPDPVSGLSANAGDTKVDLSWTNPATPFDQIKVVRKAGADPADPTDGTLVYSGTGTSVSDTGLTNGTSYHYAVWATRGAALSNVVRAMATPSVSPVTSLNATFGDGKVDLSWTNPTTAFDLVKVVRKAGADPADPSDGTLVYSGTGTSVSDTGLTNGTSYHYAVWVSRGTTLSAPVRANATPAAPPDPVTTLVATAASTKVDLSWTNPTTLFDLVKVVRKAGADPASPSDGSLVYSGTAASVSDTGLTNGTEYRYAVWVERAGLLSTPARAVATPK